MGLSFLVPWLSLSGPEFAAKVKTHSLVGEWVRILRLLDIYAAGSPECRMHVLVPVLVHMAMIIIAGFWLPFIRQNYIRVRNTCQGENLGVSVAHDMSGRNST